MLAQVAVAALDDLRPLLVELQGRDGVASVQSSIYAEIFKRSTVRYRNGIPDVQQQPEPVSGRNGFVAHRLAG